MGYQSVKYFFRLILFGVFTTTILYCFIGMEDVKAIYRTNYATAYYDRLLNITNFKYSIAKTDCSMRKTNTESIPQFVVLVHSQSKNFHRRLIIRETWGQERSVAKPKVYFLLGESNSTATQKLIEIENDRYEDLIQGNFIDSYRNLTFKHTMALKWFKDNCAGMDFLVKTDDDVFVNIPPLFKYLSSIGRNDVISCAINWDNIPLSFSSWAVTPEEYPDKTYPPYCKGYAIVYARGVVDRLYRQAQITRFFWIDDVQITGIVRKKCNISLLERGNELTLYPHISRLRDNQANWADFIFQLGGQHEHLSFMWDGTRRFRTLQTEEEDE